MDEIEYMWPLPSTEAIKVYCWMKMLYQYEIARLSRLNIIERPSQHKNHDHRSAQEAWIRSIQDAYRPGTTNTSTFSNNTWSFV